MSKSQYMTFCTANHGDAVDVIAQLRTIIEHVRETGDVNLLPGKNWHVFRLADDLVCDHETLIREPV